MTPVSPPRRVPSFETLPKLQNFILAHWRKMQVIPLSAYVMHPQYTVHGLKSTVRPRAAHSQLRATAPLTASTPHNSSNLHHETGPSAPDVAKSSRSPRRGRPKGRATATTWLRETGFTPAEWPPPRKPHRNLYAQYSRSTFAGYFSLVAPFQHDAPGHSNSFPKSALPQTCGLQGSFCHKLLKHDALATHPLLNKCPA